MAGEVVRPLHGLDAEPPVFPGPRLAVLEHDHAADRLRALEVGDVVALDAERRPRQAQGFGQLLQGGERLAMVGQPARVLAGERIRRVPCGQIHECPLLATPGNAQVDRATPLLRKEVLEVGHALPHPGWHVYLARDRGRAGVVLLEEARKDLVVGRLADGVQQVHVAPDHLAVTDDEQGHRRLIVLARHPDHVELGPREGGHLLALHRALDRADLVAVLRRALVVLLLGGGGHLDPEGLDERLLAAFQEELDLLDIGAIVVLRDGLDAGALAALDVVQQARPLERTLPVLDVDRAGAEREQPAHEVHRLVHARRRGVRAEVATPVVHELARPLDPREVVAERDLDVWVALVVLEPHVEAGLEPLDEVRFEEQRLRHAVDLGHLDVRHTVDDAADPVDLPAGRLLLPIAADAAAQTLGLADVQDVASAVPHKVDAGAIRESLEGRFELGGHAPMLGQVRRGRR